MVDSDQVGARRLRCLRAALFAGRPHASRHRAGSVRALGLPPPHIGFMISNPVSRVVGRSPLTIEVTLPLWWKRGKDEGVADVRLIEDVGGFAAEVIAIHTVPERKPPELGNR